jgi:hypothetical protein
MVFVLEKVEFQWGIFRGSLRNIPVSSVIVILLGDLAFKQNMLFGLPSKGNSYVPKHSVPSILYLT